ncbi:hypothetical protein FACS189483_09470 [Spirochaetia bacterium]|nr:hypothetical protein FACS189483_09470 [Spirochaetia bacterium]
MKKKVFRVGFLGVMLALGMALTGCDLFFPKSCQDENDCDHGSTYCGRNDCNERVMNAPGNCDCD